MVVSPSCPSPPRSLRVATPGISSHAPGATAALAPGHLQVAQCQHASGKHQTRMWMTDSMLDARVSAPAAARAPTFLLHRQGAASCLGTSAPSRGLSVAYFPKLLASMWQRFRPLTAASTASSRSRASVRTTSCQSSRRVRGGSPRRRRAVLPYVLTVRTWLCNTMSSAWAACKLVHVSPSSVSSAPSLARPSHVPSRRPKSATRRAALTACRPVPHDSHGPRHGCILGHLLCISCSALNLVLLASRSHASPTLNPIPYRACAQPCHPLYLPRPSRCSAAPTWLSGRCAAVPLSCRAAPPHHHGRRGAHARPLPSRYTSIVAACLPSL